MSTARVEEHELKAFRGHHCIAWQDAYTFIRLRLLYISNFISFLPYITCVDLMTLSSDRLIQVKSSPLVQVLSIQFFDRPNNHWRRQLRCTGARAPSTSKCLIFQVTSEPHKLWHLTPCGCLSSKITLLVSCPLAPYPGDATANNAITTMPPIVRIKGASRHTHRCRL